MADGYMCFGIMDETFWPTGGPKRLCNFHFWFTKLPMPYWNIRRLAALSHNKTAECLAAWKTERKAGTSAFQTDLDFCLRCSRGVCLPVFFPENPFLKSVKRHRQHGQQGLHDRLCRRRRLGRRLKGIVTNATLVRLFIFSQFMDGTVVVHLRLTAKGSFFTDFAASRITELPKPWV